MSPEESRALVDVEAMHIPEGLRPWARRLGAILTKPYPPAEPPIPNQKPQWEKFGNWALICEDLLDTESDPRFIRMCYDELRRRGLSDGAIQKMHVLAWLTAGWLNHEKCMWEWGHLGQDDIETAIKWQLDAKLITGEDRKIMMAFMKEREGANRTRVRWR